MMKVDFASRFAFYTPDLTENINAALIILAVNDQSFYEETFSFLHFLEYAI